MDMGINTGTDLGSVAAGLGGKSMDTATYQKGLGRIEKALDDNSKEIDKIPDGKPPQLEPPPEFKQTDPWQTFGGPASFLAMFGSLMTKHPLTSALNAGAGVIEARNKGDYEAYKTAFDKWKVNSDNAWKMADWEQSNLKNMYDRLKDKRADLSSEMEVWSKMTQDPTLDHMEKAGAIQDHLAARQKNIMEMKKAHDELELQDGIFRDKVDAIESKTGQKATPAQMHQAAKEAEIDMANAKKGKGGDDDPANEEYQKKYEEWKKLPSSKSDAQSWNAGLPISGFIRGRGKDAEQQLEFAKDYAKELDSTVDRAQAVEDFNAANTAMRSYGSGKNADIIRSFNVAYSHADLLGDLAVALRNGDVQKINSLKQAYEEETGQSAPTNFDAAKGIFSDEVNKAAVGGPGALADREAIRQGIIKAESPEQIQGAIDTYKGLIIGQIQGQKQEYEQSTKRRDFERLLSSDVADDLKKHAQKSGSKDSPLPLPKDNNFKKDKWYTNDKGEVGKYVGEKDGQHVFE